jgi:NitT/TauT family transport system permease protein/sulfonate transport system permease protein
MKARLWGFGLIVLVLLIWEALTATGLVDTPSVPRVSEIALAWWRVLASGEMPHELWPSLYRIATGYGLAVLVAVPLGLLMGASRFIYGLLEPATELLRPIPSSAYIPIAILFLGIGDGMKMFAVFFGCVFPILVNTSDGVKAVDPVLIDTGRTFGLRRGQILGSIIFPAAIPAILTGMRVALSIALIVVVVAEMVAGSSGIGYFILDNQRTFRVPEMFAGIFTLGVLGYLANALFLILEARALRWRPAARPA